MQTTQQRAYVYHTRKKQACQRKKQRECKKRRNRQRQEARNLMFRLQKTIEIYQSYYLYTLIVIKLFMIVLSIERAILSD